MGYGFIPLIASIVLLLHHIALTDASRRSKSVVATAVGASLVVWQYYPRWLIFATVVQAGASVYMLIYLKLQGDVGR